MKKNIVKLSENDLTRLIKKVLNEDDTMNLDSQKEKGKPITFSINAKIDYVGYSHDGDLQIDIKTDDGETGRIFAGCSENYATLRAGRFGSEFPVKSPQIEYYRKQVCNKY